jgi:hypothetical protein
VRTADPVASGIVARLDRPSGNVTGFAILEASLGGKWLELLAEIAPGLKRAAIMFIPETAPVSVTRPGGQGATGSSRGIARRSSSLSNSLAAHYGIPYSVTDFVTRCRCHGGRYLSLPGLRGLGIGRIDQHGNPNGFGHEVMQ